MISECGHGYQGQCCCNCEFQRPLAGHPNNKMVGTRSIDHEFGYVCLIPDPDFYPTVVFFENRHGMCEYWQERDYTKYPARHLIDALSEE